MKVATTTLALILSSFASAALVPHEHADEGQVAVAPTTPPKHFAHDDAQGHQEIIWAPKKVMANRSIHQDLPNGGHMDAFVGNMVYNNAGIHHEEFQGITKNLDQKFVEAAEASIFTPETEEAAPVAIAGGPIIEEID